MYVLGFSPASPLTHLKVSLEAFSPPILLCVLRVSVLPSALNPFFGFIFSSSPKQSPPPSKIPQYAPTTPLRRPSPSPTHSPLQQTATQTNTPKSKSPAPESEK